MLATSITESVCKKMQHFIRPDGTIKKKKEREREREKPGYNVKIELFPFGAIDALVPLFKPL